MVDILTEIREFCTKRLKKNKGKCTSCPLTNQCSALDMNPRDWHDGVNTKEIRKRIQEDANAKA